MDAEAKTIDAEVRDLVDYLTFVDEAALQEPVRGVSTFTRTFAARGPKDRHRRSLREFDLDTRLFRHRLSYMIYSDLFDALPQSLRNRVYARLREVPERARSSRDGDRQGHEGKPARELVAGNCPPVVSAFRRTSLWST